jgi:hypothetical protein
VATPGQGPRQRQLLHRYAVWHLLRRLRQRTNTTHATSAQAVTVKRHIKAAIALLDGLAARGRTLADAHQGDLDAWLTSDQASHRRDAGHFARWANRHKLTSLEFPATRWHGPACTIDTEARWAQARWLLHDHTVNTIDRVTGLFVLLYAQIPAAVSRLTLEHVQTTGHAVRLRRRLDHLRRRLQPPQTSPRRRHPTGTSARRWARRIQTVGITESTRACPRQPRPPPRYLLAAYMASGT